MQERRANRRMIPNTARKVPKAAGQTQTALRGTPPSVSHSPSPPRVLGHIRTVVCTSFCVFLDLSQTRARTGASGGPVMPFTVPHGNVARATRETHTTCSSHEAVEGGGGGWSPDGPKRELHRVGTPFSSPFLGALWTFFFFLQNVDGVAVRLVCREYVTACTTAQTLLLREHRPRSMPVFHNKRQVHKHYPPTPQRLRDGRMRPCAPLSHARSPAV